MSISPNDAAASRACNEPVASEIENLGEALAIVCHPAFRLGFLDAQRCRPLDHFSIIDRIYRETPPGALERLGWGAADWFGPDRVEWAALAEYRYEEGRLVHLDEGLRCKAWGHPDCPPRAVMDFIIARFLPPRPEPTEEEIAARRAALRQAAHDAERTDRARQGVLL